ncbi:hypothetical protein [Moorena sp. SIO3H5]|uniref:hypothetical protein n=1 Tax=Moorena sp. SIO3H5 TaxID=2607834 RepID=UPI0013B83C80|nr:hypothetical protein [Moorena sp. SIO3H5]NEO72683.1 hypothetical protein [Moorena sp. SIO3H5]
MEKERYRKIRERTLQLYNKNPLLFKHFHDISGGMKQVPSAIPTGNVNYLSNHDYLLDYHDLFQRNMGIFDKHFVASIPFLVEENCRIGVGIYRLAQHLVKEKDNYITLWETGGGDGVNGRTMAEFSKGLIRTLSTSTSVNSKNNFYRLCNHDYSKFHHGSFINLTPEYITSQQDLSFLYNGFNIIYENVTFPFYGSEREDLIDYVARLLKKDSLIIFLEKLRHPDESEYRKREKIKDDQYKANYFSDSEIEEKRVDMLEVIERGQVDFKSLTNAIKKHFKYVYLIWNSANFYEFVASNNELIVSKFIELLPPIYVPSPFCAESNLPRNL